jgi:hypothetical protein
VPLPPSHYVSGPVSPQQVNTDLYGIPATGPSGVLFHANRPLLSETVTVGGTAYSSLSAQPVDGAGIQAFSVIDTTSLFCVGADSPGSNSQFRFGNYVPSSAGSAGVAGGYWLTWGFPCTGPVTSAPGGVGAGMAEGTANTFANIGTFQYGTTLHPNTPYYLDIVAPGSGSVTTWKPAFWWLTASTPTITGSTADTSGQVSRMGWLWQSVSQGGSALSSVPSVAQSWGTVSSAMLNGMGSALALLNNPPVLRTSVTSGQSFASSSAVTVGFTSAPPVDNYAGWSTVNSWYTAPLPGLYLFCPTIAWGTASSSGQRWSGLRVSAGGTVVLWQGGAYAPPPVGPGVSGVGLTSTAIARVLSLHAGDTVGAYGWQSSGANLALYTGYQTRLAGAYMTPLAASGTVLSYTPPVSNFRFQAGALSGTALTAALNARIGNDVSFLLNRPYFTGYQSTSQNGFANNATSQVTIDTLGALPRGGNGDSYAGWSTANSWYVSQEPGWYLVAAELYATPPSATTATLTASIFCSSSGGITPVHSPDEYQQVYDPIATGGAPPSAFAMGVYYLDAGEYVYPMLEAQGWGGTWGTYVNTSATTTVHSQFSCWWVSNLRPQPLTPGGITRTDSASSAFRPAPGGERE